MTRYALALVAVALLALPSTASAARVEVSDGVLRYTAAGGELNWLSATFADGEYRLFDAGGPNQPGVPTETGSGCRPGPQQFEGSTTLCAGAGVERIVVALADRDDRLTVARDLPVPYAYSGGAHFDSLGYWIAQETPPLTLSADGVANDGVAGRDDIATDVESLGGGGARDTLVGSPFGSRLGGGEGDDTMTGGDGDDRIYGVYVEDVGPDAGSTYPVGVDTIACRGGADQVIADSRDRVAADCEIVARPYCKEYGGGAGCTPGFRYVGSRGADYIRPDRDTSPAWSYGGAGNDRMFGDYAGGELHGQSGNDRMQGGPEPELLSGGTGSDVIRSQDARRKRGRRDVVRCGSGRDVAYVDTWDSVARDCEKVRRRGTR